MTGVPSLSPCAARPSGRHRWVATWTLERRAFRRTDDPSARTCRHCGVSGEVDRQGIVRPVLTPAIVA